MNEFVVKKDSWHYKFLGLYYAIKYVDNETYWRTESVEPLGYWAYTGVNELSTAQAVGLYEANSWSRPWNFCMYWRAVLLWPAIRFAINIAEIVAILWMGFSVAPLVWAVGLGMLGTAIAGAFAAIVGVYYAFKGVQKLIKKAKSSSKTDLDHRTGGLFETLYTSYKKKYCPAVTYEKGDVK